MLVEISGIDGSGKSTLIRALKGQIDMRPAFWCYERNFRNRARRFLESIAMARRLERADDLFPSEALALVDAVDLVDEAVRTLHFDSSSSRQIYLVDHYRTSWMARAIARSREDGRLVAPVYDHLPKPSLSFSLVVPPAIALERLRLRGGGDQVLAKPDALGALSRLGDAFDCAIEGSPYPVHHLDGERPIAASLEDILSHIDQLSGD